MPGTLTVAAKFQEGERNTVLRLRPECSSTSFIHRYTHEAAGYLGLGKLNTLSPAGGSSD